MRYLKTLASTLSIMIAATVASEVSAQSAPTPFPCDGQLYQIATRDSTLKALNFVETANGYTTNFRDINNAGANLNSGWGYNVEDNLIYGVRNASRDLWRIDFDGNFDLITTLDNTFERGSFVGDIAENNIMIYRSRDNVRRWQLVDISDPANPVNNGVIDLTGSASGADFAYNAVDGNIYGIDGGRDQLFYVDISGLLNGGGTATPIYFGPAIYSGGYGAQWFDENGRFYIYNNNDNGIEVVNVGVDGNGTGSATFLATSTDEEGGTNDGAYCRGPAPVPLGGLGGTVYQDIDSDDTFGPTEPGAGAGIGVSVYFDNGTLGNFNDDTLIGTTDTLPDGTYSFDGLVTIETYRVEVDSTDPDRPQNSNLGTSNSISGVVVSTNAITPNNNFGFDPGTADLEITKTADVTVALPGDTVTWTISVFNRGNGSPANVMVSDLIPSGFTYVSDDAPTLGDYYDPTNGNWFVDEILIGATETLNIVTTANEGGERTNFAEIIFSSMPDPDSDFNVGRLINDGTDDDEASFTVTEFDGATLGGTIFLDNGAGNGTAYDAMLGGTETAGQFATVVITDSGGTVLATPPVSADGTYLAAIPRGNTGTLTITTIPTVDHRSVSEATAAVPGLVNASQTDGTFTFTPDADVSYAGLDFGLIAEPTLTENQSGSIVAGQALALPHLYVASSTGVLSLALTDFESNPAGAFTSVLFRDEDCDGTPDTVVSADINVVAGQTICLVVRTQASGGVSANATYSYGLTAVTDFTGTGLVSSLRNDDAISDGSNGALDLRKLVTNITAGTLETTVNSGKSGDILQYRLVISNPGVVPATDIKVTDQTPAWTNLSGPIPSPVAVAPGVNCAIVTPADGGSLGYSGALQWMCPGSFPAGAEGSVTFSIVIQ